MTARARTFVVLNGGLGNQLFQVAAAASVRGLRAVRLQSQRSTQQLDLAVLMPGFLKDCDRLDRWMLGRPFRATKGWRRRIEVALQPVRMMVASRTVNGHIDVAEAFAARRPRPRRPLVLDGYFQRSSWYEVALPELVDVLLTAAPRSSVPVDEDAFGPTVLHVRGGDYPPGWRLDVGYYERALGLLGEAASVQIITDDFEAGEQVAEMCIRRGWECSMSSRATSAADDFWTVAAARRLVMSNSTFCWWAAQVGDARWGFESSGRVVVFPEQWVMGSGRHLKKDPWLGLA